MENFWIILINWSNLRKHIFFNHLMENKSVVLISVLVWVIQFGDADCLFAFSEHNRTKKCHVTPDCVFVLSCWFYNFLQDSKDLI